MRTILPDLYRTLVKETAASFIFGTTSTIAKELFKGERNLISKNITALRRGVEHAEHALLYNTLLFVAEGAWIKKGLSHLLSTVVCSFISARKNGMLFAVKSAIFTLFTSSISSLMSI